MKLKDKVAIVTGAARGIGRATALRLASEGAKVVIVDIDLEEANKVADEIKASGYIAVPIKADVTKSKETKLMAEAVLEQFEIIDILINVAGGIPPDKCALFQESKEEVWDWIINLNLKGMLNCSRAVIEHMIERRSGRIVNIAAIWATIGSASGRTVYAAAKAGVIGFSKALAKEVGQYGININCVSPGAIETRAAAHYSKVGEQYKKATYMGRFGEPEEMANMIVFLASDEASFITGQDFSVCGAGNLGL